MSEVPSPVPEEISNQEVHPQIDDDFTAAELWQDTPNIPNMPGVLHLNTPVNLSDLSSVGENNEQGQGEFSTELLQGVDQKLTEKPNLKSHILERAREHPIAVTAVTSGLLIFMGAGAVETGRHFKDAKKFLDWIDHGRNKK